LYSEFIGMPVFSEYSSSPLALIKDAIIDPENGKLLALLVKNNHIIVPMDIERSTTSAIFIADNDRILPVDDVLRVKMVLSRHISIPSAKVITEKNHEYLGRVTDFEIDTTHMVLANIHVAKQFLFLHFNERIIDFKHIVRIEKHSVIVKEQAVMSKAKVAVGESAFAG
ncbi:MAG: PRC-barrel domain-containing protein, partial [Patescibacteria group bacterium]